MHAETCAPKWPSASTHERVKLFESLRHLRDMEMARSFRERFDKIVQKYDTLCRSNGMVYKKMSKVTFIEKTGGVASILSTLNKLTPSNADVLSNKIVFKCTQNNLIDMINQILSYGSNAEVNHDVLVAIVVRLSERHTHLAHDTKNTFDNYYRTFIGNFDTTDGTVSANDDYGGFLDQNVRTSRIKGSLCMLVALASNPATALLMRHTLNDLFRFLTTRLDEVFVSPDEILKCLLTDCIYIIVASPHSRKLVDLQQLHDIDFHSRFQNTSNRHRFRMYDIFDILA